MLLAGSWGEKICGRLGSKSSRGEALEFAGVSAQVTLKVISAGNLCGAE